MKGRCWWLVLLTLFLVSATAQTSWAGPGCFRAANDCFRTTVFYETWWERFTGALDCELDLAQCIRIKLLGL